MTQIEKAGRFAELHVAGDPLLLYNAWDAGSATVVAAAGTGAIATSSWSVAAAHGYPDGEAIPLDFATAVLSRVVTATDLPVSVDFEGGYAAEPATVADNVGRLLDIGVVGINFEDGRPGEGGGLYDVDAQCERIHAIRRRADEAGVPLFLNARTDLFLGTSPERQREQFQRARERAEAYADAGANGFFVPALTDEDVIAELCDTTPLPVNIMIVDGAPSITRLAELGVARVSYGPLPFVELMEQLKQNARRAFTR